MFRHSGLGLPLSWRKSAPSRTDPSSVRAPNWVRAVCRRLLIIVSLLVSLPALAFLAAIPYLSVRYNASLATTVPALIRGLALTYLKVRVAVYDPCSARLAALGPDGKGAVELNRLLRAEDYFHSADPIHLLEINNASIVRSRFPFYYQPYDEPRLHELRRKYHLDEVIKSASSELEEFVLLLDWTRSRFRRQDYQPGTQNFDALEILDRNLKNLSDEPFDPRGHMDPCHFFPFLYCQIVLAMGHTSRLVSIGHGMAEVWSNQFQKWITMDAELDLHYEKDGIPLNMLEVHDENFQPGPCRAQLIRGKQAHASDVKKPSLDGMIKYHLNPNVIVEMRNDWITNHYFAGHPRRSEYNTLIYEDPRWPLSIPVGEFLRPRTSRKEDFYWTLNQTEIWVLRSSSPDCLDLVFKTVTPNFDHFEIRVDGEAACDSTSDTFAWRLHEGENALSVVARNQFGIKGIASSIRLRK
jgi:hypothetical protein